MSDLAYIYIRLNAQIFMTASQKTTVNRLKNEGWTIKSETTIGFNGRRRYPVVIMQNGDEFLRINHQGGTGGLMGGITK